MSLCRLRSRLLLVLASKASPRKATVSTIATTSRVRNFSGKEDQPSSKTEPDLLLRRFINPWVDAVAGRNSTILAERIDRYTEGFAVVSTLLCALSAAALANIPQKPEKDDEHAKKCECSVLTPFLESIIPKHPPSPHNNNVLHDAYAMACCTSFFSGACALGLSTVLNVVGAVAPRSYIQNGLILRHSLALSSIPLFATISGGWIGVALVVGIDMTVCSPTLTYIGIGQLLCRFVLLV